MEVFCHCTDLLSLIYRHVSWSDTRFFHRWFRIHDIHLYEQKKEFLEAIDARVMVVSNVDKEKIIEKIFPDEKNLPEFKIENFSANTRAFVKVQDGCNSYCSYCIIIRHFFLATIHKCEDSLLTAKKF